MKRQCPIITNMPFYCTFPFFLKEHETLFIIFATKVDDCSVAEVEFSSENVAAKRMPVTVENEYTISVAAPGKYPQEVI